MATNFTFNQNTGSSTPSSKSTLFGASTTTAGAGSSLFGGNNNTATTSSTTAGSLFGSGGNAGSSGLFGNQSSTPASTKPGGLFGGTQATAGASPAPAFGGTGGTFGGGGGGATKSLLFGANASTGAAPTSSAPTFSFANAGGSGATTPAANKTSFLSSTTPAGPPPGASMFSNAAKQPGATSQPPLFSAKLASTSSTPSSNLFGTVGTNSTPAANPIGSTTGSGGPGLFNLGGNKDAATDASNNTQSSPSLFSAANPSGTSGMQSTQPTPKPSLFGGGSTTPAATPASKPPTFGFGTTTAASTPASTATAASPLSFGANKPAPSSTEAPKSGLFNTTPAVGATSTTTAPAFNFTKPGSSTPASSTATGTTAPTATPNTAAPSLFGAKPATMPQQTTAATAAPTTTTAGASGTAGGDAAKIGLGNSAAGPTPSKESRLKNKSMDEIITRWAADLSKYQKEFQSQAETVARWDRALVENSDKVKQLYSKTYQAERDAAEVERQLTMMEENQKELDEYLDRYEKEIDNMMKSRGVGGRSDGLRGPDQERERTYKLAEKLQDRLNELNKDLTEMIQEINLTSQTLSKTGKDDDPLTKVVRVLNSQLSQLQLIDSGAAQLQDKINKAQKESHRLGGANGWNGLGSDPSEDFYRSFRGGRSDRFGGVS